MGTVQIENETIANLFKAQPQPAFWLTPVWNHNKDEIVDFAYSFCNEEMHNYADLVDGQLVGKQLSNSPLIPEERLRKQFFSEILQVYNTGVKHEGSLYNPIFNKYYSFVRAKVEDGVLTILQDRSTEKNLITQLEEQAKKLEEQSNITTGILNSSLFGIYTLDAIRRDDNTIRDFKFTYINHIFSEITGRRAEDIIGKSLLDLYPNSLQNGYLKQVIDILEEREHDDRKNYSRQNEQGQWFQYQLVKSGNNQVVVTFQDITEQKRALAELQQQKSMLDNILKYSPTGISVSEALRDDKGTVCDWKTIMVNEAAVKMGGNSAEDILGKTVKELSPALWESPLSQAGIDTLKTGEPFITRFLQQPSKRWMEISVAKMDDDHLINVFTDVTEIKTKEQEIEESEKTLKNILNRQLNVVSVLAPVMDTRGELINFRIRMLNEVWKNYVERDANELVGSLFTEVFPSYKENGLFDHYKAAYNQYENQRFTFNYCADGLNIWMDVLATRLDGELMVCFQDVTESRKFQVQLERLVEELQRSNVRLEEFAYASSHDLKEPIRKIRTFSDRLKQRLEGKLEEDEIQMFQRMDRSAERMELLVEDLLAYSHVSQKSMELEEIDLNDKIRKLREDLEVAIQEAGATFVVGHLPIIKGHRRQMQQLFQNLITNSLKYRRQNVPPVITITGKRVDGEHAGFELNDEEKKKQFHLIEVADNGLGFEQQYAEKIFQMFQRLHGKSEYSGTGVGLSIARKVVENHHGHIWAEGNPGVGSTFKVLLPA